MQPLDPDTLARIRSLELRARQTIEGFITGGHRSKQHGFAVEFAQHREYVPGDDIRHIDWKVYGRTGTLLPQAVRAGNQPGLLAPGRCQRVDALRLGRGHQVRPRLHGGRVARLPGRSADRQRRAGDVRLAGAAVPAAGQPADAPEGRLPVAGRRRVGPEVEDRTGAARSGRPVHAAAAWWPCSATCSTSRPRCSPGSST